MTMHVGIDVGSTLTNAVAITEAGTVRRKEPLTRDGTNGIFAALGALQERVGQEGAGFFGGTLLDASIRVDTGGDA